MSEEITISKDRYLELLNAEAFLQCLENAGVDNWDGIDFAQEEFVEITYGDIE